MDICSSSKGVNTCTRVHPCNKYVCTNVEEKEYVYCVRRSDLRRLTYLALVLYYLVMSCNVVFCALVCVALLA